jgi:hypothetical protein
VGQTRPLTGETSDTAIVLTTLVAASSCTPIRRRLEALAERLFRYEEPHFGAYRQSLSDLLGLLDPEAAARRLVDEATRELRASAGWVEFTEAGTALSSAEDGGGSAPAPCPPVVSVEIPGRHGTLGRVVLGPRLDGTPCRAAEVAALVEVARLVGRALDVGAVTAPAAGGGRDAGGGRRPGRRHRVAASAPQAEMPSP